MSPQPALSEAERFPLISDLSFLFQLIQDPHAPEFNFKSGDRLNKEMLSAVCEFGGQIRAGKQCFSDSETPIWLTDLVSRAIRTVPAYKHRPHKFIAHPFISRTDLQEPWRFVPDDQNLENLLVYYTSGATDEAIDVLSHPITAASYLPLLEYALEPFGVTLNRNPKQVTIACICAQKKTLTYASLSAYLGGAGYLKLNLDPTDWRNSGDAVKYLERYNPQVLSGDPFALESLLNLGARLSPEAIVSTATTLLPALRKELSEGFRCPVLNLYSLTECRAIAADYGQGFKLLRPDLYLEIIGPSLDPLPFGEPGEIAITGGNNPFLPLIRYRTGDRAALEKRAGEVYLRDFEGRPSVCYFDAQRNKINTLDISLVLGEIRLSRFSLCQHQDLTLELRYSGQLVDEAGLEHSLHSVFGELPLELVNDQSLELGGGKWIEYLGVL